MPRKKPVTYEFRTVADMQAVPVEKLGAFCEDLRLWLTIHRIAEATGELKAHTPLDVFGWIDDGRHDITINLHLPALKDTP